ncbi:MAG: phosphotransferase [Herpetosiphonaceae bacterium]|nr:phosphotransferase [Herpetosiphonaceae bacterium]
MSHLDHLPQTICHQDVWRKNLFARSRSAGDEETVAIDWELVGVGAAGEDVGNLLGVSLLNFDVDVGEAAVLAETMLTDYLAGLSDVG